MSKVAGSQTGVYIGCFANDYNDLLVKDLDHSGQYAASGTAASLLSNRVSWFFDLKGPSITIDTACSSSLVAAHQACMSLRLGEIDMVGHLYGTAKWSPTILIIRTGHCWRLQLDSVSGDDLEAIIGRRAQP